MIFEKPTAKKIVEINEKMKGESSDKLEKEYNDLMEDAMGKMIKLKKLSASEVDKMMAAIQQGQLPK
jgi:hypothetical protein